LGVAGPPRGGGGPPVLGSAGPPVPFRLRGPPGFGPPPPPPQGMILRCPLYEEKLVTQTNTRQEQHHKRSQEEPPPSLDNDQRWRGDGAWSCGGPPLVLALARSSCPINQSIGLYTISSRPISYSVWLTKGGSGRSRLLRNSRAIVLQ